MKVMISSRHVTMVRRRHVTVASGKDVKEEDEEGVDEEGVDTNEKAPTEAGDIVTWHGWRQRTCIVMQGGPFSELHH